MSDQSIAATVIICTRDRASSLSRIIEDLLAQDLHDASWEILVVDNGSTDNTAGVVERATRRTEGTIRYIPEPRPGKSFALNTGVAASRGAIVAFTDDDVAVDPTWLRQILDAFRDPSVTGVGGRVIPVFVDGPPHWLRPGMSFPYRFDLGDARRPLESPPFGANMAYRRSSWIRYGPFRTDLGPRPGDPIGGEDSEFGSRLLGAGERLVYLPDAAVRHPVSSRQASKAFLRQWHYHYGRAEARRAKLPAGIPRWAGVPRYLYRELLTSALWACLGWKDARLRNQLRWCRARGEIAEMRALAREASDTPRS